MNIKNLPISRDYSYDDVWRVLQDLPVTWYPALLKAMVEAAIRKKVFKAGGVAPFVKRFEDAANSLSSSVEAAQSPGSLSGNNKARCDTGEENAEP